MAEKQEISPEQIIGEKLELQASITSMAEMSEDLRENILKGERVPKKPSKIKFFFLFLLAIIVDIVDSLNLTGVGYAVSAVVSVLATLLLMLIAFITRTRVKKAEEYNEGAVKLLEDVREGMTRATKNLLRVANIAQRAGRFAPAAKGLSRGIKRGLVRARRALRASPYGRILITSGANLIPLLALVPWMTLGIYLTYRNELELFNEAKKNTEDLQEELGEIDESMLEAMTIENQL